MRRDRGRDAQRGGRPPVRKSSEEQGQQWRVTPAPDGRGAPPPHRPRFGGGWVIVIIIALFVLNYALVAALGPGKGPQRIDVSYNPFFLQHVRNDNVKSISSQSLQIEGTLKMKVKPPGNPDGTPTDEFKTQVPAFANNNGALLTLLEQHHVKINAKPPSTGPSLGIRLLLSFAPTILIILIIVFIMRRAAKGMGGMGGGMGGLGGFSKSRARRAEPSEQHVTFKDVAGIDEAKAELAEIVDFLRNPARYGRLGGKIPRGLLLSGAPGTGKTLLARAVAGEAHVPFFQISASEFVEAIVGVGASRVRDMFTQAKESAPAIIFIDELDAIGRSRASGAGNFSGGHDEREQTLNQILTEMDGFDPAIGVIVVGATNRPEILDNALLRPGRFDRRITVSPPDKPGREKILEVHTRGMPLDDDVDLSAVAAQTPGMVGADLANLCNEAALTAARYDRNTVTQADFSDSLERILLGAERRVVISEPERRRTAYHESGHAVVGMLTPGADPVRKVSIIPRGESLGVTFAAPDADRFNYDRRYLEAKIRVALGGRVAEELVYGDVTTGAESDIQQLTEIARRMVGRWGMSDAIGPIAVLPAEARSPLLPGAAESAEYTQRVVDDEVRKLVEHIHAEVTRCLTDHRSQLEALVAALLEHETLDGPEVYAAAGIQRQVESEDGPVPADVPSQDGRNGSGLRPGRDEAPAGSGASKDDQG
jgi:cell division protease FtsH